MELASEPRSRVTPKPIDLSLCSPASNVKEDSGTYNNKHIFILICSDLENNNKRDSLVTLVSATAESSKLFISKTYLISKKHCHAQQFRLGCINWRLIGNIRFSGRIIKHLKKF